MTKNTSGGQSCSGSEGSIPRTQNKEVALLRVTQPLLIIFGRPPQPATGRKAPWCLHLPFWWGNDSFRSGGGLKAGFRVRRPGARFDCDRVQTFGWFWCFRAPTWNVKARFPFRARLLLRVHVRLLVRFRGWYCFYGGGEGKVKPLVQFRVWSSALGPGSSPVPGWTFWCFQTSLCRREWEGSAWARLRVQICGFLFRARFLVSTSSLIAFPGLDSSLLYF